MMTTYPLKIVMFQDLVLIVRTHLQDLQSILTDLKINLPNHFSRLEGC